MTRFEIANDELIVRGNMFLFVSLIVLLIILEKFFIKIPVILKWFVSVVITMLTYIIVKWFGLDQIELFKTLCWLFVLQSLIYVVFTLIMRKVVHAKKGKYSKNMFRIVIVGTFAMIWWSYIPTILNSELKYVILIPVVFSFITFMLTEFLKIVKQDIPQINYLSDIVNTLNQHNSTPLQLLINLHIWCSFVYLFYEMLV